MRLSRFIYLAYYLYKLDWDKFLLFQRHHMSMTDTSYLALWYRIIINSLRYNISILEYFQFNFFDKEHGEKLNWAGTGFMYEYQKVMNPPIVRDILDDKTKFYKSYKRFFVHHVMDLSQMKIDPQGFTMLKESDKLVLKESNGKCGLGTTFIRTKDFPDDSIIAFMEDEGYDLAESFISQHSDLNRLSPSGVNTIRIFTQLNKNDEVEILGCRQRISVNSQLDNLAAGNLAAPINEETGIIDGPAVYSDITKSAQKVHPVTGVSIVGFVVPYWKECLQLAKEAALEHPQNRSIGWDIVVTETGPGLIEGNHDWCKLVWQLPIGKGLKPILAKHLQEYST